jgi:putative 4-mercaptohistidine N1-methyltranferase
VSNPYEAEALLGEYLLFHYGTAEEILPYPFGPREALGYAVRCVSECVDAARVPAGARALDLGCAVGRSSFELARSCGEVIAIDYSQNFIRAALELRERGELAYLMKIEGNETRPVLARVPVEIERARVQFEHGDAMTLREDLGHFDVVLMANLIDRLREPRLCLERLRTLVRSGGQLIITSPYTWLEEYTPRENWLGQRTGGTLAGLRAALERDFDLKRTLDLPFLIREHARKFQWSVAQGTIWERR